MTTSPFFLTGDKAKVVINGRLHALVTDIAYNISVKHANPHVLGMYEAMELQPLSYNVTGSFTIIRYIAGAYDHSHAAFEANAKGNGIGEWRLKGNKGMLADAIGAPVGDTASDGRAHEAFNPRRMHQSMMFDIEIQQNSGHDADGEVIGARFGARHDTRIPQTIDQPDGRASVGFKRDINKNPAEGCVAARIRDCRIVGTDFKLSKKNVAMQTYSFQARYVDEDSFNADFSGVGQQYI